MFNLPLLSLRVCTSSFDYVSEGGGDQRRVNTCTCWILVLQYFILVVVHSNPTLLDQNAFSSYFLAASVKSTCSSEVTHVSTHAPWRISSPSISTYKQQHHPAARHQAIQHLQMLNVHCWCFFIIRLTWVTVPLEFKQTLPVSPCCVAGHQLA